MSDQPPPPPPLPPPSSSPAPPPPPPLHSSPPGFPPAPTVPGAPPGYTPYNTNPMAAYAKKLGGLAKAIQVLMYCIIATGILSLLVTLSERQTLVDYLNGEVSETDAENALAKVALPSSLAGLLQIAVIVLTMIWMFRLAKNLQLLGRNGQTWKPGWAIGGWFLPPFLFVIPWLMFRELWKGSDPAVPPDAAEWKRAKVGPIVDIWWVLYGLAGVVVAGIQFGSFGRTDIDDVAEFYADSIGLSVVASAISVVSAVAYVFLVRKLTARQKAATGEG